MNFFEAVEETGKARWKDWIDDGYWRLVERGTRLVDRTSRFVELDRATRLLENDWLPYHEPEPCEACELTERTDNPYMSMSDMKTAIKFLLKNPAVHDEGCKEAK